MINREEFYTAFADSMFETVVRIDPYKEVVYVASFKENSSYCNKEYTLEKVRAYMEKRLVIDTNNVCSITA